MRRWKKKKLKEKCRLLKNIYMKKEGEKKKFFKINKRKLTIFKRQNFSVFFEFFGKFWRYYQKESPIKIIL